MCEVTPYMVSTALVSLHLMLFFLQTRLSSTFQLYSDIEQSPFQLSPHQQFNSVSVKASETECILELIYLYIKLKSRPSVRHTDNSPESAYIDLSTV